VQQTPATEALQWPPSPNRAKLSLVGSLTGFSRGLDARTALRVIAHGRDGAGPGAFGLPVGVARGGDGRIAVADAACACVHLFVPVEQRYARLTGGKERRMVSPIGVAFDAQLRLYVSDSTGVVFGFDHDGALRTMLQTAGSQALLRPTGLAYSPRTRLLYVVDTLAGCVHAFNSDASLAFSFGQRGDGPGEFNHPTHIACSPQGELYVTNSLAFRVEIFDEQGRFRGSFGRHGDGSGDLALPKGVAVDRDGVVYVVDGMFDNVQLFDRQGAFLLTLGARGVDPGEFWLPSGAFIGEDNELYVCDTYNRRIQVFRITERYDPRPS
jgi:DNA-binding beta-propeller fold protein YncE